MDQGGVLQQQPPGASKPSKFAVYQNPVLSAALTSKSLLPTPSTFVFLISLASSSLIVIILSLNWKSTVEINFGLGFMYQEIACTCIKLISYGVYLFFTGTLLFLVRAVLQWRNRNFTDAVVVSPSDSKGKKELKHLTQRQLSLLGIKSKHGSDSKESSRGTQKPKSSSPAISNPLVPLHQSVTGSDQLSRKSGDKSSTSGGSKLYTFSSPSKSPSSPSMYLVPVTSLRSPVPSPPLQTSSPGTGQLVNSPWSSKRHAFHKNIATEEDLEKFLADVDDKISGTDSKFTTPPPSINGLRGASPNSISGSVSASGNRSTPLRQVRMTPGSQKFKTPPKKGEGDLPPPMSMEESVEAFERLDIYQHIEQWRDRLRQWFAAVLLNPLLNKIENSHLKVIEAAAKLNIPVTISPIGSDIPSTPAIADASSIGTTNDWKPAFTVDEDGLLHQLRATLVQVLDASKLPTSNFQQSPQLAAAIPVIQECVDAITEHQRLHTLMKGEWGKGLLPQSSVRADYTVGRIRKLAEGTCLKNYEYLGNDEAFDKAKKKWSLELPSDSHLLLYLFCAFLEFPKWMLHVDPTTYAGTQSSKNPLFLGVLPPKERFPEKYVAVISSVPPVLHPGACILAVGKQSPPLFALYWDKKPQFSLQGRTALWDSILLLCFIVKTNYDGIIRGLYLGSSALSILPVLEQDNDE